MNSSVYGRSINGRFWVTANAPSGVTHAYRNLAVQPRRAGGQNQFD